MTRRDPTKETPEDLDLLKVRVSYDPESGLFTWLTRPRDDFIHDSWHRRWNREYSGTSVSTRLGGYVQIRLTLQDRGRVFFLAHRAAFAFMTGKWPNAFIDHINHVRDDNRWGNLRLATHRQNMRNVPLRGSKSSKYRGVSYNTSRGQWIAQIGLEDGGKYIGIFSSEKEAALAYDAKAKLAFGDFAQLNFP